MQSVGPLKALYTSPPGRPVHSGTNSTSVESIQTFCIYIYSQVLIQMCEPRQLEWNSSFKMAEKSECTHIIRQVVTNCRLLTAHILMAYFFQKSTSWTQKNTQLLVVIMLCFLKFSLPLTHTTKKHLDHS